MALYWRYKPEVYKVRNLPFTKESHSTIHRTAFCLIRKLLTKNMRDLLGCFFDG